MPKRVTAIVYVQEGIYSTAIRELITRAADNADIRGVSNIGWQLDNFLSKIILASTERYMNTGGDTSRTDLFPFFIITSARRLSQR